jgi:hypothetical protein
LHHHITSRGNTMIREALATAVFLTAMLLITNVLLAS